MRQERQRGEEVEHGAVDPAEEGRRRRDEHHADDNELGVEDEEPGEAGAHHAAHVAHAPAVLARREAPHTEAPAQRRTVAARLRVLHGLLSTSARPAAGAHDDRQGTIAFACRTLRGHRGRPALVAASIGDGLSGRGRATGTQSLRLLVVAVRIGGLQQGDSLRSHLGRS